MSEKQYKGSSINKYAEACKFAREVAYPNDLDSVLVAVQKVEEQFNMHPRQLESIIQFHCQYHQFQEEQATYSVTQVSQSVTKLVVEIANNPKTKKSPAMVAALAELLEALYQ